VRRRLGRQVGKQAPNRRSRRMLCCDTGRSTRSNRPISSLIDQQYRACSQTYQARDNQREGGGMITSKKDRVSIGFHRSSPIVGSQLERNHRDERNE
jgi:hypothetical protein